MNFSITRLHRQILAILLVILCSAILLFLFRVPVHVRGEVTTEYLEFSSLEAVPSFFALDRNCEDQAIQVGGFREIDIPISRYSYEGNGANSLNIKAQSNGARARFKKACLNGLSISPGVRYRLQVGRGGNSKTQKRAAHLQIEELKAPVKLTLPKQEMTIQIRDACIQPCNDPADRYKNKSITLHPTHEPLSILAGSDGVDFMIRSQQQLRLSELDTFLVENLSFLDSSGERARSGLVGGFIQSMYDQKSVDMYRNAKLLLNDEDHFKITSLSIISGEILIEFEGVASSLTLADGRTNLVPNALEYLSKNNALLLIINTLLAIGAIVISVIREITSDEDKN